METDIDSNFSSTEFFNFSNSTVKPTLHFVIDEKSEWMNAEIARLIHIIIKPILIVFGTIGNCLSFYIMRRMYQVVSTCPFWRWQTQVGFTLFIFFCWLVRVS